MSGEVGDEWWWHRERIKLRENRIKRKKIRYNNGPFSRAGGNFVMIKNYSTRSFCNVHVLHGTVYTHARLSLYLAERVWLYVCLYARMFYIANCIRYTCVT